MAIDTTKGVPGINLAALNGITDQNTRTVLQSLIDGWHVRNGNAGSGDSAFVTRAELGRGLMTGTLPGTGGGSQFQTVQSLFGGGGTGDVGTIISKMQAAIMESPLFKSLGTRITLIDAATVANGNTIATEITDRANADNAIYTTYNSQISSINTNIASLSTTQTTQASTVAALSSTVTTLTAQVGTNTTAISTEASARASADGTIEGKYAVKIDSNGYVTGFGLISTANNSTPYSAFIVRADQFAIGSPSGPGITPQVPFIVNTTTDSAGNPAGVYIDTAMIKILTAGKIDTRGLTVKDSAGNVILGSGSALDPAYAAPGTLNSALAGVIASAAATASWSGVSGVPSGVYNANISIGSNGVLYGAGGGSVSLSGLGAGAMAYINQINSGNIWTYIGAAAIGTAFITNAAITNALIGDAEVGTLKVAGNAIGFSGGMSGYSGGISVYCVDGGMISCVCFTGGNTDVYNGNFNLVVDGGVPMSFQAPGVSDGGGGWIYGPATQVWQGYWGAGWHSVGFYQNNVAYALPQLLWFFSMR